MKTALIGISNNIKDHKNKIKVWSESFRSVSDGKVILLGANMDDEDRRVCREELKITYEEVHVEDTWYINNKRLFHTVEYLKKSDIDIFLVTDVFDVVFQSDPFLDLDLNNYDIFVGTEGIYMNEEPWNSDVMNKCFPNEVKNCSDKLIICSGVIAGKRENLISLLEDMHNLCENAENGHNIRDQAALIVLVSNNKVNNIKVFDPSDSWVIHCAVAGPTNFFDLWGFKGHISDRYGIPKLEGDKIINSKGELFSMVHQFNRIPKWNDVLVSKYIDQHEGV